MKRVMYFSGFQLALATAAGAVLAAIGQYQALAQGRIQHRFALVDQERGTAVDILDFELLHNTC